MGKESGFRGFAETGVTFNILGMAMHYHEEPVHEWGSIAHSYYDESYFNRLGLIANIGAGISADISNNFSVFTSLRIGYDILPLGNKITDKIINETWTFDKVRFFYWTMFIGIVYNF